jgi:signal transduction histidine kinase/CheY-like chemotaxis protein
MGKSTFYSRRYFEQIFFVVGAFAVMAVIAYFFISRLIVNQMREQNQTILNSATYQVCSYFNEIDSFLLHVTADIEFMLQQGNTDEEIQEYLHAVGRTITARRGKHYLDLKYTGLFGELHGKQMDGTIWNVPETYHVQSREWYLGAKAKNGGLYYSKPYISVFGSEPTISLAKAVFDTKPDGRKEFAGVFCIDVGASAINEVANASKTTSENSGSGYVVLVDAHENVIAHPFPDYFGKPFSEVCEGGYRIAEDLKRLAANPPAGTEDHAPVSVADFINKGIDRITEDVPFLNYKGEPSLYYGQLLRRNNWAVISVTPTSLFFQQTRRMGIILAALGTIMSAVLCFFLTLLHREKENANLRNRSKSTFLAKMSHEIRTPMNAVINLAHLIVQEKNLLPPRILNYALEIRHAGDSLLTIINDILDLSKIEAGKLEILHENFSLTSLLEDVIVIIRTKIYDKGLQFITYIDPELPDNLIGDIVHTRQILLNILGNAAKYTSEGYIAFEVTKQKREKNKVYVQFIIRDTGIGIKDEDQQFLFSEFTQFETHLHWNIEGTGLGLAIANETVRQLGGSITMFSKYRQGTTFTVTIPIDLDGDFPHPVVSLNNIGMHNVLVYEPLPLYEQSLIRSLTALKVKHRNAHNVSQLHDLMQGEKFTFVFVEAFIYDDISKILESPLQAGTQVALLCENFEQIRMHHVRSIVRPVNALHIANLLNNTYESGSDSDILPFRMPQARILVVDDNRSNLVVAEGLLGKFECQLDFASNGKEAVRLVQENRYDMIFMDHMMPEMDGIEATEKIREMHGATKQDTYYQDVPIIALTANAVRGMKDVFLQHGMSGFLPKPIELKNLNAIVTEFIPADKQVRNMTGVRTHSQSSSIIIPGVDTRLGIRQTGGTVNDYISVISVLVSELEEKTNAMEQALRDGNLPQYRILVHSYKSLLATIGVMPLSATAAMMEIAAQNGDRTTLDRHHANFIRDLCDTAENIRKTLEARGYNKNLPSLSAADMAFLYEELGQLKTAIDEMSMKRIDDIMDSLRARSWTKEIAQKIEKIEQHIMLFEWKEAAVIVEEGIQRSAALK